MQTSYEDFIYGKLQSSKNAGFDATVLPDWLFGFQRHLVEWSVRRGRAAIFGDCGLGKTPIQLVWAQNIVERTNRPVLVLTPLAVSRQTVAEAEKFHIDAVKSFGGSPSGSARIVVTNYERLHLFSPDDFSGIVCDESSILKNFDGVTKASVTEFMRSLQYRLLCTATAAPNDYIELGTSSEALGELGYIDMLGVFFKNDEGSIAPLSFETKWKFKPHAAQPFWRWVCSWARAFRRPSDLGFEDNGFVLPELREIVDIVQASRDYSGMLFPSEARTLQEQRAERKATIRQRCERVAEIASRYDRREPFVAWCHLNAEADLVEELIPDAVQVSGDDSTDEKEEKLSAFSTGQITKLVTKPKIGAFGLNWQHCHRLSCFPSHSYEQYYQLIRRCWRFGQTSPVDVYLVTTEGEADVLGNLNRKSRAASEMFDNLVREMTAAEDRERAQIYLTQQIEVPQWIRT